MATFVFIPGAGGAAWYWHRLTPLLEKAGHRVHAVELPGDDPRATLETYARRIVKAIGKKRDVVLVAQSLGGFTAPLVCERARIRQLVFVNAMIPVPNERPADWGPATGSSKARLAAARRGHYSPRFDEETYFFHDVSKALFEEGKQHDRRQAERVFLEPCRFTAWPEVPTHVIAGRNDRLFPLALQRNVALTRLGRPIETLKGGHLVALSNPAGLARKLLAHTR